MALTVVLGPLATLAVACGAVIIAANVIFIAGLLISLWVLRPGDARFRDHAASLASLPQQLFAFQGWNMRLARLYTWIKPAPLRVAEVAVAYMHSQALFVMVNLGVAEALQDGPKTALELAAAAGPGTNAEWLARVLKMAAELGLVHRKRMPGLVPAGSSEEMWSSGAESHQSDAQRAHDQHQKKRKQRLHEPPCSAFHCGWSCNDIYSANAATAVLCRQHPNCMADFVKLFEDHFAGFVHLSEGISSGVPPFMLWSGGRDFWQHLKAHPDQAATFDGAMRACNHTGAKMAVEQYPWHRYDVIVDVGGGNGQFLMELLTKDARLRGVLVDQDEQVHRGKEWWSKEFQHLLPRMEFVVGDMFVASSLPKPEPGRRTLYVLKQILHDWSDADSLAILRALRSVMGDEAAVSGSASLVVLETGVMENSQRFLLQHRLEADMTMLMAFGDGKERDEQQMQVLLEAAGFAMGRLVPTTGVMAIIEAAPLALGPAGKTTKVL